MITSKEEYERYLANIADSPLNHPLKMRLPTGETIYQIDLNTRKIQAPPFIGVECDHKAEYIFFEMDRYFDFIDLSKSIGMIIFRNAKNEEYMQIIPYYDIYTHHNKIIFPWVIQAPAALYSGQVSFSMKFFEIDSTSQTLTYELNTLTANTKVLVGWGNTNGNVHTYATIDPQSLLIDDNNIISVMHDIAKAKQYQTIFWIDLDENHIIPNNNDTENDHILDDALPESDGN